MTPAETVEFESANGVSPSLERAHLDHLGLDVSLLRINAKGTISPSPAGTTFDASRLPELGIATSEHAELALRTTLGQGGMGVVKSALQRSIGRQVAVKLLRSDTPRDIDAVELTREATITGRLEHPSIVPVYALGRDDRGRPAMVMKQIEGRPWSDVLDQDAKVLPLDRERLGFHLEVLMQVCRAVSFAHSRGILHRDLKPDNVMLGEFGEIYVVDWGLAVTVRDDADPALPRARDVVAIAGTPAYMAPEMAAVRGEWIGERTDVYLLGGILHEILTGRCLHDAPSVPQMLARAFAARPVSFARHVPEGLAEICLKATRMTISERYDSVDAFRDDIATFLRHRSSHDLCSLGEKKALDLVVLIDRGISAPEQIHRLLMESRFAFDQALAIWSGNQRAKSGLQRVIERVARVEIERGNRDGASALMAQLPEPEPALERELDALQRRLARREQQINSLRRRTLESDVSVDARTRRRLALLLAIVAASLSSVNVLLPARYAPLSHYAGAVLFVTLVGLLWLRLRKGSVHAITGRFMSSIAVTTLSLLVFGVVSQLAGDSFDTAYASLLVIIGACCGVAAVTLHPLFSVSAAIYATGFVVAKFNPSIGRYILAIDNTLGLASMMFVWWYAARLAPRDPRDSERLPPSK
jgi:serine/threonine-protein kinase